MTVYIVNDAWQQGHGSTPGLALRDLWRKTEAAVRAGEPADLGLLPERRRRKLLAPLVRG